MRLSTSMDLSDGVQAGGGGSSFANTKSCDFDGVDDYLEITQTAAYTTTTLSMWIKTSKVFASNIGDSLASNDDGTINQGRTFFIGDTPTSLNNAYIGMRAGAIIYGKVSGGIPVNDGNWHHLAWTYDSTAVTSAAINMYVDGVNQYSNATNTSYWSRVIKYKYFGKVVSAGVSDYFIGNQDEISIWGTALSAADVLTLYNSGTPTDLSSALATAPDGWWRNGDGDVFPNLTDNSANSNTVVMTNMLAGDIVTDVP